MCDLCMGRSGGESCRGCCGDPGFVCVLVSVVSVVVPGSGRPGLGFGRLTSPCMTGHMGPVHTIVISRAKAVEVGGCCLSRGWSWGGVSRVSFGVVVCCFS